MADKHVNIKDRVFLVSGGTSGVGKAIATGLARMDAKVVLISRSNESGKAAVKQIAADTRNERVEFLTADLSLQSSILKLSEEFKRKYNNLHTLINAAGAVFFEKQLTAEGIDKSLAVNYLSHFSLTIHLLDVLKSSAPARVITVAGAPGFLKDPKIDFDDLQLQHNYSGLHATSEAMFARIFFAFELAKKLRGTGVTSVAFHPGLISSNLVKDAPWWLKTVTTLMKPWEKRDCEVGTFLATAPEAEKINGVFFDDKKKVVALNNKFDPAIGGKLWEVSEQLISLPGVKS